MDGGRASHFGAIMAPHISLTKEQGRTSNSDPGPELKVFNQTQPYAAIVRITLKVIPLSSISCAAGCMAKNR